MNLTLTFQLQTLDRMSVVWNPSHSTTPNEQRIRGILCSSYAQIQYIFKGMQIVTAYWEVREKLLGGSKLSFATTRNINVIAGRTPTNTCKGTKRTLMHIFEKINQCSVPYQEVHC
jgi:hypothetical protein